MRVAIKSASSHPYLDGRKIKAYRTVDFAAVVAYSSKSRRAFIDIPNFQSTDKSCQNSIFLFDAVGLNTSMNDIDFEKNPWRDLASLLWERVPVDVLASAIENHGLWVLDRFGRVVEATDGDGSGNDSKERALRLLAKHYALQQEERSNIDPNALIEFPDTPLANYGWPDDEIPDEVSSRLPGRRRSKVPESDGGGGIGPAANPHTRPPGPHLKGVSGKQIHEHFNFWDTARWLRLTQKPPEWLASARIQPVSPRKAARWNPVLVAISLDSYRVKYWDAPTKDPKREHARNIRSRVLLKKIIRTHFPSWEEELDEYFTLAEDGDSEAP